MALNTKTSASALTEKQKLLTSIFVRLDPHCDVLPIVLGEVVNLYLPFVLDKVVIICLPIVLGKVVILNIYILLDNIVILN